MATAGQQEDLPDGIRLLRIDHPPVNAIAMPVRAFVHDGLARAAEDPAVRGVVIAGTPRAFSAGADLAEFEAGSAMSAPSLHGDILPRIARFPKPVVAAVSGVALGGGFELALGCHERVFAEGTKVGLPETTLGLMPGAGGTQWLPRMLGFAVAADLIARGTIGPVDRYAATSLVSALVPADRVVEEARRRAAALADRGAPFAAVADAPLEDDDGLAAVEREMASATFATASTGVRSAYAAILRAAREPVDVGMRTEFSLFAPLLDDAESQRLRRAFTASRGARRAG